MSAPAVAPLPQDVAEAVAGLLAQGLPVEALLDLHSMVKARLTARRPGPVLLHVNVGPRAISSAAAGGDTLRVYHTLGCRA